MQKLIFILSFLSGVIYSQDSSLDSLKLALKNAKHDTTRCAILYSITNLNPEYFYTDSITDELIEIAQINSITENNQLKNKFLTYLANGYSNKIYLNKTVNNYNLAIEYAFKTLSIDERLLSNENLAYDYNTIADIYFGMKNIDKALVYYNKTYVISKKYGLKDYEYLSLLGISNTYIEKKEYMKAIVILKKTLVSSRNDRQIFTEIQTLNTLARIYILLNELPEANLFAEQSLKICRKLNNDNLIIAALKNNIDVNIKQSQYEIAESYCLEMQRIAKNRNNLAERQVASKFLSIINYKKGNWKLAYDYEAQSNILKDSIQLQNSNRETIQKSFQEEYKYRSIQDSIKIIEQKKITSLQLNYEKKQRFILYGGLIFALLIAAFIYNRFKITQKQKLIIEKQKQLVEEQKHIVEEKHKEITESVEYAERIQQGYFTSIDFLNEHLKTGFILFKPKDKVSGDFYWSEIMANGNVVVCVADSTGHGVPGAFMSLLNMSLLNESVYSRLDVNTGSMLDFTRKILVQTLKPNTKGEGGNDGMDCVLFSINYNTLELQFSGANNNLWIVRCGFDSAQPPELIELKGDKMPVGRSLKADIPFTSQKFQLQKGDWIYASTDGFGDQFGGEKGKKFMSKNLKDTVLSICHLHEDEQKEKLDTIFENWRGHLEQVDDVTVMGIRI